MRQFYQNLSITGKLRLLVSTLCLGGIALAGATMITVEWFIMRGRMVENVVSMGAILAENIAPAVSFRSAEDAREIVGGLRSDPYVYLAVVTDQDGAEFARYATPAAGTTLPAAPGPGVQSHFAAPRLYVWIPIQHADGRVVGTLTIERSQMPLYRRIGAFALVTAGVLVVVGALLLAISHPLQRFFTRPLLELAAAAEQVTAKRDFSIRVRRESNDEIGTLADAFNVMLADIAAAQAEADQLYRQVRTHATELEARVSQRTVELQRAYEELETFSYSVSHDLRAPLRSIAAYTEVLLEDAENRLTPESLQHSRRILASVTRMNSLIDGLLDLARLSKRELQFEPLDMGALMRDVVSEVGGAFPEREVRVIVGDVAACVGDPVLVRQVLLNLVANAFKYTRERPVAEILLGEVRSHDRDERIYFVKDNGAGFEMQRAKRLFQVFERLHDPRRFEGTGIGLATTKRIIERHGGRIWAEGEPERGAVFYFALPAVGGRTGATQRQNETRPLA